MKTDWLQITPGAAGFLPDRLSRPLRLQSARNIRKLESLANAQRISNWTLMRRAGRTAFDLLGILWPKARRLTVITGSGNNGGDGCVLAALAVQAGYSVNLVQYQGRTEPSEQLQQAQALLNECSAEHLTRIEASGWQAGEEEADVVVDALFGTGLARTLTEEASALLRQMKQVRAPVFALDIPSGLHADTGDCAEEIVEAERVDMAVKADATLTFIAPKLGLFTGKGRHFSGAIFVTDLGLIQQDLDASELPDKGVETLCTRFLSSHIPQVPAYAHKASKGRVLVLGGSPGMGGAAILAAEAALVSGSGLVTAAIADGTTLTALLARRPEVMGHVIQRRSDLEALLSNVDAVVVGPGLAADETGADRLEQVLHWANASSAGSARLVLDAGALRLLASSNPALKIPADTVLTPHPGEAAQLLACSTAQIQQDRQRSAVALAQKWQATVILKGSGTIVADSRGQLDLCPSGSIALATAGTGDVLTGLVGSLLAMGMEVNAAAALATAMHAEAGDRVAALGTVTASSLISSISELFMVLQTANTRSLPLGSLR
ncbi:MAG: NAD(P)H-hydrate dehydratase [Gammaproteobacteria bacterium]